MLSRPLGAWRSGRGPARGRGGSLAAAGVMGSIALLLSGCQQLSLAGQSKSVSAPNPATPPVVPLAVAGPVTYDMSGTSGYIAVAAGNTLWMSIPFDSGVSINQLRYGQGFGCAAPTPPSSNGPQGYLFLANSPLNLNAQYPCISVDGTAAGSAGAGVTMTAADGRTASVLIVSFSGVDQAGGAFSGHFELVLTTWRTSSGSGRGGGYPHQVAELWPSAPEFNTDGTPVLDANGNQAVYVSKLVLSSYTPAPAQ
jgi:hypothetical protein